MEIKNIWRSFFLSLRPLLAFGFVFFCLWIYRSLWCAFGLHVYYEKTPFWEGWTLHLTFRLKINDNSSFFPWSGKLCNLKLLSKGCQITFYWHLNFFKCHNFSYGGITYEGTFHNSPNGRQTKQFSMPRKCCREVFWKFHKKLLIFVPSKWWFSENVYFRI